MRIFLAAAALVFGLFGAGLASPAVAAEFDSNRPGGDYRNFIMAGNDPQVCQAQCDQEGQCVAWTFVKPGIQGPQARCWLKQSAPAPRADSCCVSGLRTAGTTLSPGMENGSNRPGGDYRNFELAAPDPQICKAQCESEGQCASWTFVRPGVQGPNARCWLKSAVPPRRDDNCCVSGVNAAARPPAAGTEPGINRPGSDYRNFELAGNDPLACRAACETEGACRSWTFVRPGVQGPAARCWLKGSVPQAQPNACCTSGVKTAVAPPPPPQGNNACNTACEQRCRQRGRPGGAYNGGICLLGVPEESACTCR